MRKTLPPSPVCADSARQAGNPRRPSHFVGLVVDKPDPASTLPMR
jgi:hypothetical protein